MNFDEKNMKILGVINGGANSFGAIKSRSSIDSNELENILTILENEKLISKIISKGFFGQPKISIMLTQTGKQRVSEYKQYLEEKWKEIIKLLSDGEREKLDQYMTENPYIVKTMLFFGIINLPTLNRLNLQSLLKGENMCYVCKKDLGKFIQKFSVDDCKKFHFKIPKGMTIRDEVCANCFDNLTNDAL